MNAVKMIAIGLFAILSITALSLIAGYPVKWSWNYVMPHLFDLPSITFWQAFALYWLSNMLIKSTQTNTNNTN